jgi:hypothetical protein
MRFISPYPNYRHVCLHEQVEILATGLPKTLAPGFTAEFKLGDVTDYERELARATFTFKGVVNDMSGRPMDPIVRVSSFDSNAIKNEKLRAQVEQYLLNDEQHGRDFISVQKPAREAPWPAYDKLIVHGRRTIELVAEKIVQTVAENGYNPDEVAAYEAENLNRPEVLAALEGVKPEPEPEEQLIAA